MKNCRLADAVLVAALLLAYVPGLADDALPAAVPAALIAPAPEALEAPMTTQPKGFDDIHPSPPFRELRLLRGSFCG